MKKVKKVTIETVFSRNELLEKPAREQIHTALRDACVGKALPFITELARKLNARTEFTVETEVQNADEVAATQMEAAAMELCDSLVKQEHRNSAKWEKSGNGWRFLLIVRLPV